MCLFQKCLEQIFPLLWPDRNVFASSFNANSRGEKKKRKEKNKGITLLTFWRTWGKAGRSLYGKRGMWREGAWAGNRRPSAILWLNQVRPGGQTLGWESSCPRSVWKQHPSFALWSFSLIQSREKSEWNWVCVGVHVHLGDGQKDGDNGQSVLLLSPAHFIPVLPEPAPIAVSPFQGPGLMHGGLFFPPQTQVLIETEISTESWPLGCPIPLWHCSAKGYAHQSLLNLLALGLPRILRSLVVLPCGKVYFVLHGSSVQYCFYFRNWELHLKEKWLF